MPSVPIALEVVAVHSHSSCLEFRVYSLDKTFQTVYGKVRQLEEHIRSIQAVRNLADELPDLLASQQKLEETLKDIDSSVNNQKNLSLEIEKDAQERVKQVRIENPIPNYNKHLAKTLTSRGRREGVISSLVVTLLGIAIFFSGEGSLNKWVGGGMFLIGGFIVAGTSSAEVNDSEEAKQHRELQEEAERIQKLISATERNFEQEVKRTQKSLRVIETKRDESKRQLSELMDKIQLAQLIQAVNKELGSGVVFGNEAVIQEAELWIAQQSSDSNSRALAGAALVGLMIAGAFLGIGS
ncbi:hypothetical protein ACN4EK_18985 [Pantanalinema rosaneae CENA516]|uniref:hypothetical protein n=1 Tax=Pantanalinema rosaneae TaxID=1620701 RepID=UPI003D6DB92C